MYTQEVVQKLRFYTQAREQVQRDRNLSPQGKERAAKNLEQSIELFRGQAFETLNQAWKDARRNYEMVENLRKASEIMEGRRWNYEKLNFETGSAERRLKAFRELPEMAKFLETELQSGNAEHVRAVLEVAPGVVRGKFPGVEGERLSRELTRRLETLLDTPELEKVRKLESEGGKAVLQLVKDTEEVSRFYSPGFMWTGNEFQKLLENVHIERSIHPDTPSAFERTTIEFVPEPAGA